MEDFEYLEAFIGWVLLSGVYICHNESIESLYDTTTGRNALKTTIFMEKYKTISWILQLDNRKTRPRRQKLKKLRP